jgi:hypothetical protein
MASRSVPVLGCVVVEGEGRGLFGGVLGEDGVGLVGFEVVGQRGGAGVDWSEAAGEAGAVVASGVVILRQLAGPQHLLEPLHEVGQVLLVTLLLPPATAHSVVCVLVHLVHVDLQSAQLSPQVRILNRSTVTSLSMACSFKRF